MKVTLADGTETTYEYDRVGNVTKSTEPGEAVYQYTYDAINRLTEFTDGRGGVTSYGYDELSRLLSYTTPEGSPEISPKGAARVYNRKNNLPFSLFRLLCIIQSG